MLSKRKQIKDLVDQILDNALAEMKAKVGKVIVSGAIDTENWSPDHDSMLIPKAIVIALLENEADQYKATGTTHERKVSKDVENIKLFL